MKVTGVEDLEKKTWKLEQSLSHMFQYLIDYEKQKHNIFQLSNGLPGKDSFGPLLYLDNDRGRWDKFRSFSNTTACLSCTFARNIVEQLLLVEPKSSQLSLGELIRESLYFDPLSDDIWFPPSKQRILDLRVDSILDCVRQCLNTRTESQVLFDFDYHRAKSQSVF